MMDPIDAPTVESLWDRAHVARKAGKVCGFCKKPIEPGQKYQTSGYKIDGQFEIWVRHYGGERYPSGCPTIGKRDRLEAEEQFRKDQDELFPKAAAQ